MRQRWAWLLIVPVLALIALAVPRIIDRGGGSVTSTTFDLTRETPGKPPCQGGDCGKNLTGDWSALHVGDCVRIRSGASVDFTRVSCRTTHDAEVYFAARPDPVIKLSNAEMANAASVIRHTCGKAVLRAYAPHFWRTHAHVYPGMWGDGKERVCVVQPDRPTESVRSE